MPSTVVLFCHHSDASALAAACALDLARRTASHTALACVWTPEASHLPARALSSKSVTRLASQLRKQGLDATARGRLVRVVGADTAEHAASEFGQALASTGVPTAIAIGGLRDPEWDRLCASADVVVAALAPDATPALDALARFELGGGAAVRMRLGPCSRALAEAGVFSPPAVAPLLRGLDATAT